MQRHFFLNSDASKYYTEGVFSVNPLKDFIIRAKEIRNAVPNKYDSSNAMKKFVDKYYDDIIRINKILEREKDDRAVFETVTSLGWIVAFIGGAALMSSSSVFLASAGMWLSIISTIILFVNLIISNVRRGYGEDLLKLLKQIRDGLSQINLKSLPREYKIKIVSLIKELDDTIMNIGNGFDPPPPPDVHFVYSLNSGSDYDMDNETYTEGTNIDVGKKYRAAVRSAHHSIKNIKKLINEKKYDDALDETDNAIKNIQIVQKEIKILISNPTVLDTACGWIYRGVTQLGKGLVLAAISFGVLGYVYAFVASWKNLILAITTAYTQLQENDFNHSFLNLYVNHVNHVLNEILKTLEKMRENIKELQKKDKLTNIKESEYDYDNFDDIYTEGFTKDVSKTYRDSFNLANNKIKEAKKFMKSGEYIEARVSIKQARDAVTTAQKQINEMSKNTNLPDNIIGMIYGNMISLIKALVFALPTLGFSFGVAATKNLYTRANAYYTKIKNKEDMDSSVFNTYLNHVNHVLNEVIRTLNKLEAEIAKKENSSSSSDTTSKPNKKKIFNKKDKNINESTSVKVLLASDLLADMEDLF